MPISVLPYPELITSLVTVVYPLYCSVVCMVNEKEQEAEKLQWLSFWIIHTILRAVEGTVLFFAVEYVPLYLELKIVAYLWLMLPHFRGAAWIHDALIVEHFKKVDALLVDKLGSFVSQKKDKEKKVDAAQDE
uniref:HVA22-like protein n=1 Tax=Chromera velia CCMP2878 TaxID=1169474 RepID=A0A0G4FZA3_9ALVE|mmetsp:Transcript_21536/g.42763  ORF Transcript_21536/g.42763 Transcript_21536/m.42763 type:complete len:133 (+) Transcript_21536:341-739(+)|eukprot:Cvel_19515.t1-p1 / transcript=Cvel_19515.t1 / gene=Cvel_19515 / organism=Chromera_velia_CCMP2878 / gene_product=HVA22-like protein d, putative / transcript_product=HVA22-like protein d, putative / location=Cvel_scaffold1689:11122-14550(+) / protein_length=132 / sequence_SO=supercontig / SO=protein_coding / is_pseudo=false